MSVNYQDAVNVQNNLSPEVDQKWTTSTVEYSYLGNGTLPDYYFDGLNYAGWFDDIVNQSGGVQEISANQKYYIDYMLQSEVDLVAKVLSG